MSAGVFSGRGAYVGTQYCPKACRVGRAYAVVSDGFLLLSVLGTNSVWIKTALL
jgi:hypothetical protein